MKYRTSRIICTLLSATLLASNPMSTFAYTKPRGVVDAREATDEIETTVTTVSSTVTTKYQIPRNNGSDPVINQTCYGDYIVVKGQQITLDGKTASDYDKNIIKFNKKGIGKAKKVGSTDITIDDKKIAVTVVEPELSDKTVTTTVGTRTNVHLNINGLDAEDYYNLPVDWYTSNPNVAEVYDGVIQTTGVGKGSVYAMLGGKKYTVKVTVNSAESKAGTTGVWYNNAASSYKKVKSMFKKEKGEEETVQNWELPETNHPNYLIKNNKLKSAKVGRYTVLRDVDSKMLQVVRTGPKKTKRKKVTVGIGESTRLYTPIDDMGDVPTCWKSSKPTVASVGAYGTVTGHSKGKATIRAKIGTKTIKFTVTVTDSTGKQQDRTTKDSVSMCVLTGYRYAKAFFDAKASVSMPDLRTQIVYVNPDGFVVPKEKLKQYAPITTFNDVVIKDAKVDYNFNTEMAAGVTAKAGDYIAVYTPIARTYEPYGSGTIFVFRITAVNSPDLGIHVDENSISFSGCNVQCSHIYNNSPTSIRVYNDAPIDAALQSETKSLPMVEACDGVYKSNSSATLNSGSTSMNWVLTVNDKRVGTVSGSAKVKLTTGWIQYGNRPETYMSLSYDKAMHTVSMNVFDKNSSASAYMITKVLPKGLMDIHLTSIADTFDGIYKNNEQLFKGQTVTVSAGDVIHIEGALGPKTWNINGSDVGIYKQLDITTVSANGKAEWVLTSDSDSYDLTTTAGEGYEWDYTVGGIGGTASFNCVLKFDPNVYSSLKVSDVSVSNNDVIGLKVDDVITATAINPAHVLYKSGSEITDLGVGTNITYKITSISATGTLKFLDSIELGSDEPGNGILWSGSNVNIVPVITVN